MDKRLRFNAASHRYWLDGKPVPGVTTIIKEKAAPALVRWMVRVQQEADIAVAWRIFNSTLLLPCADNHQDFAEAFRAESGAEYEHEKQSRAAADIGTQLHCLIEKHLKAQLGVPFAIEQPVSDQAQEMFSAHWLPWAKDAKLEPLFVERFVFDDELRYAGIVDLGARIEGTISILDWKGKEAGTLDRLYMEPVLQNHAYRRAMHRLTGQQWAGHVVNVARDGSGLMVHPVPYSDEMADAFVACLTLYRATAAFEKARRAA